MFSEKDTHIFLWIIITIVVLTGINNLLIINGMLSVDKNRPMKDTLSDALYFTTTTFSSVGYGDITPTTTNAKLIVAIEQILLIFLSLGAIGYEATYNNKNLKNIMSMVPLY